jgi:L-iditol 2-dehydrogenase
MKSARFFGIEQSLKVVEEDRPTPRSGEVLVHVRASAICGSDLRILRGAKKAVSGVTLGHEVSGEVAETAGSVREIAVGDRVTIYPSMICGHCYYCLHGYSNLCVSKKTLGYAIDGGFSEYVRIPAPLVARGALVRLPPALSFDEGALMEPFSCCLSSLEISRVGQGSRVVIIGGGPMGLMHVLALRHLHGARVIVSDPIAKRREVASRLGAEITIDPEGDNLREAVLDETDGVGADACILTVATPHIIERSTELLRKRGVLNIFAGGQPETRIRIDPNWVHYGELTVTGTHSTTLDVFREAVESVRSNAIPLAQVITHRFPLEEIGRAFDVYAGNEGLKVIINP